MNFRFQVTISHLSFLIRPADPVSTSFLDHVTSIAEGPTMEFEADGDIVGEVVPAPTEE